MLTKSQQQVHVSRRICAALLAALFMVYSYVGSPSAALSETLPAEPPPSFGIISTVSGHATNTSADTLAAAGLVAFGGPIVRGDRIQTKLHAVVGILLENDAHLTIDELSDLSLASDLGGVEIANLSHGRVCLAGQRDAKTIVRTPTTEVHASHGTLVSIEVHPDSASARHAFGVTDHTPRPVSMTNQLPHTGTLVADQPRYRGTETIHNFEHSGFEHTVDVISQVPGIQPVRLRPGHSVQIVNGVPGQQFIESLPKSCSIQDLEVNPPHTGTPEEATDMISERQANQAQALIGTIVAPPAAAEPVVAPGPAEDPESGVILPPSDAVSPSPPPTREGADPVVRYQDSIIEVSVPLVRVDGGMNSNDGPTDKVTHNGFIGDNAELVRGSVLARSSEESDLPPEARTQTIFGGASLTDSTANASIHLVEVTGPGAVEVGGTTLRLDKSEIQATDDVALISVTDGGLLRGTSTDPFIDLVDSQTETRGGVDVTGGVDPSLLEASSPLITLFSSNELTRSVMTMASDVIRVSGDGTVLNANLPADALALVELDGSVLTALGSFLHIDGGAAVMVRGNLISLTNGSLLDINNGALTTLVGGSSFTLTGGSLAVFGDGANTLSVTNGLCTGGCFTPPGFENLPIFLGGGALETDVIVSPEFNPFQGLGGGNILDIDSNSAVIEINGPNNTVMLGGP